VTLIATEPLSTSTTECPPQRAILVPRHLLINMKMVFVCDFGRREVPFIMVPYLWHRLCDRRAASISEQAVTQLDLAPSPSVWDKPLNLSNACIDIVHLEFAKDTLLHHLFNTIRTFK